MNFEKITYVDGKMVTEIVEFDSAEAAYNSLHEIWLKDTSDIVGIHSTKYENKKVSFDLYAKHGRLVVRLKSMTAIAAEPLNLFHGTQ